MALAHRVWSRFLLVCLALLTLGAPSLFAQTSTSTYSGTRLDERLIFDQNGNRTFSLKYVRNGILLRHHVEMTAPGGQVVFQSETIFDPDTGELWRRKFTAVGATSVVRAEEFYEYGRPFRRTEAVMGMEYGQQVLIRRGYLMVLGVPTLVEEDRKVMGPALPAAGPLSGLFGEAGQGDVVDITPPLPVDLDEGESKKDG